MSDNAPPPVQIRADVLATPAYRQGAAPTKAGFKLSSNENPFPPLPGVLEAIAERSEVNRYAAAAMPELRAQIGAEFGVPGDHVHLAAGSVAILYQLVHAAAGAGDEYLYAWPSFEAYPALGLASGAVPVAVPLTATAEHDLDAMAAAITERTRVILLCTPNNPTGPALRRTEFDRFMARVPADTLVVLDEAYREFVTEPDAVRGEDVLAAHPNLVVLRTFSKAYGLAALRIGYGVGDPAIFRAAASVSIPLSVTGIAESAARAALAPEARAVLSERIAVLAERRDRLAAALRELGVAVPEAQGNFVWIPERATGGVPDALALAADFAAEGTLVRPFAGSGVRISVGEEESLTVIIDIVRGHLAQLGGAA
ncbi:histidinol-phosphate transaminase [Leucobacter chromiireducens]|uniref:Aminotransferase class I/II-fold pyridoxal phosphate-dependent enzyme n=1 Tax=Leucobacter chromiireducens subsp. solipictus TaxID=398235 RepID=A0ABS1SM99_9MICO|nr:histidinol-phosphate transaminase [Leucobacter chromiireducens]MBL3680433.1 aminotransferase class I/II-fold pyridoxal phosphate-dependent enzyme [Leucobacter chromiireducens subsp. solipictus]